MPVISESTLWIGFIGFLVVALALDLGVIHRNTREIGTREAAVWTGVWAVLAMAFAGLLWVLPGYGSARATEFLTGYVLEQALSVDNLFVFIIIFGGFAVPKPLQHRVLFWGVMGAIVLRGIFIVLGSAVVARMHGILYVFAVFLFIMGGRMLFGGDDEEEQDIEQNRIVRLARRFLPVTSGYRQDRFFVRENGKFLATPLFLVLVVVEVSDIIFAVDSIPTIFAVTTHGLIVFTSNMFAIMGLRTIFIVLNELLPMFRFLKKAVSIILIFIGAKILLGVVDIHVGAEVSLGVVVALLAGSIVLSRLIPVKEEPKAHAENASKDADEAPPTGGTPVEKT